MLTMAIDTVSRTMSIAILQDESLVAELVVDTKRHHAEVLLPAIERVLSIAAESIKDIDLFACTLGPGSFTGVRVGVSTIKGLALALEKPVVGVSSLDALALNLSHATQTICPMLDARRQEIYVALYKPLEGYAPHRISEEQVVSPKRFLKTIEGDVIFVGDGSIAYEPLIREVMQSRAHFSGPGEGHIRAGAVGLIGLKRYQGGDILDKVSVMPRYLRLSYAESIRG